MPGLLLLFLIYSSFFSKSSRNTPKNFNLTRNKGLNDVGSSEGEGGEVGAHKVGLNRVQTLEI